MVISDRLIVHAPVQVQLDSRDAKLAKDHSLAEDRRARELASREDKVAAREKNAERLRVAAVKRDKDAERAERALAERMKELTRTEDACATRERDLHERELALASQQHAIASPPQRLPGSPGGTAGVGGGGGGSLVTPPDSPATSGR